MISSKLRTNMIVRVLAFLIIIFIAIIYHFTNIIDFFNKCETSANILEILAKRSVYYEMFYILLMQSIMLHNSTYLEDQKSSEYNYGYYRDILMQKEVDLEKIAETMKKAVAKSYKFYKDSNIKFCELMTEINASQADCESDYGNLYEQGIKNLLYRYIFISDSFKDKVKYSLVNNLTLNELRFNDEFMQI